jgi:hypothetical protein
VIRSDSSDGEFAARAPFSSESYRLNEQYNQMMLADDSREGIKMDDTVLDREENDDNYYIQESSQAEEDEDQNLIGGPIHTN